MKNLVLNTLTAGFIFLAILMVAAAAGMMDQGASISVCVRLTAGGILAMIAGMGFAGWRH